MGIYLSRAVIVGCFCSFKAFGYSWTPSQAAFGTALSGTSIRQIIQAQHCSHVHGGGELPRSCRRGKGQTKMTRTDISDTGGSSSSAMWKGTSVGEPSPIIATGAYPSLQFTNTEKSEEVDSYLLGELNLCLLSQDSVLSGPSVTKALNTASNQMVKNLLILNGPEDEGPSTRIAEEIEAAFAAEYSDRPDYPAAKEYLSCVCELATTGCPSHESLGALSEDFQLAFRRVAGVLSDFGCIVSPGETGRVKPVDKDICLSILDYALPEQETTPTRALNALANRVVRTVCVGSDEDLQALSREMDSKRERFMSKWIGGAWHTSQENSFYDALVTLVQNGLSDESPALNGAYMNSFQRLMGIVVQEVGTRSTPASEMVLKSFLAWERDIRKELTEPAWEPNPPDLIGSWALENGGWEVLSDLSISGAAVEDVGFNALVVAFLKDGTVQVPEEAGMGLRWRVEPGPTHLDTVYFDMIPAEAKVQGQGPADTSSAGSSLVSYTGYVDRGARIEARFSKRFVKMTGRMTTVVRGQERPSTRFSMRLVARGEGRGLS